MAWRLSTVDPTTGGSRAGDLFLDNSRLAPTFEGGDLSSAPPAMEISHSVAARQAPLAEAGTSPQGNFPMEYNSVPHLNWLPHLPLDTSTLQYSQNFPVTEHDGFRDVRVQGYGEQELHSKTPQAYTSIYEYHQNAGASISGNDRQGEVLTYPEGEADAVTITERDMEGLRATEYLSDNIIDFYIKYLERRLPQEERERFHFFNSFFFAKLCGVNQTSNDIKQCKIDYEQVRKWSAEVNLFEKDFVFIPVVRSSHWSLIIICHLRRLWGASDEKRGSPCILHLDSLGGIHESFKRQVRSYLLKQLMEKRPSSDNMDQLLDLCEMKYIKAEVPRQKNSYDCGVYLLHYIEVLLSQQSALSLAPRKGVELFTHPEFAKEVSHKRNTIGKLIHELRASRGPIADVQSNNVSVFDLNVDNQITWKLSLDTKPQNGVEVVHEEDQPIEEVPMDRNKQVKKRPNAALLEPSKVSKKRKWDIEETSILLNCKAEGGRFCTKNQTGMNWETIAEEITNRLGTTPSAEQCRRRYETLQKAYKSIKDYIVRIGRTFSEMTGEEKVKLKLATELTEAQYKLIDSFSHKVKAQKRAKHDGGDGTGHFAPCDLNNVAPLPSPVPAPVVIPAPIFTPAPIPNGRSSRLQEQVAIPGFRNLDEDLRTTLLLLVEYNGRNIFDFLLDSELDAVCRVLAIVQDRNPSDIHRFVFQLSALKLVNFEFFGKAHFLKVADLRVYKKFVGKVLGKNPDFNIHLRVCDSGGIVSFPEARVSLSLQRIRMLELFSCGDLQRVDLSFFPELRYLDIRSCNNLEKITGWEVVKELGFLAIKECPSYEDDPPVRCLPSLRIFIVQGSGIKMNSMPDVSQCVRLWRLEIWFNEPSALTGMDFSTLRFLEVLRLYGCGALTTIQGLNELHFLTKLSLSDCTALRSVPELGCLKALTVLHMLRCGVEEISGVQELHLLTSLDFHGSSSLKTLPCLGHLTALIWLDISGSVVEEISGVQDLVSLEELHCSGSRLERLPDLHHLPRLRRVWIGATPLSTTNPSSFYFGKGRLDFNPQQKRKDFDDDISDISDTENF